MSFVLDVSVTLAWCFEDAAHPVAERALGALEAGGQAIVPALWRLELANVLVMAERHKRLLEADTARFLCLVDGLAIQVVPDHGPTASLVALARSHGLTAYDAAYLDLALRTALPLATLDSRLGDTAKAAGVTLLQ
jgi:predicted nucleic acid-binding protein